MTVAPQRPPFDPEKVPPDPEFDDPLVRGAAVASERLNPGALRARFARPPTWRPEIKTDGRLFNFDGKARSAAVLVPIVVRNQALSVLLTERTGHLNSHAGQISFPGGQLEQQDADPVAAALRESYEEIGLASTEVEVIGTLPEYTTATNFCVTPVVGLIERAPKLTLATFEVAEAFEVPLAFLMDPTHHERRLADIAGQRRAFYAIPYTASRRYFIWGATAAMLRNFYHFLMA